MKPPFVGTGRAFGGAPDLGHAGARALLGAVLILIAAANPVVGQVRPGELGREDRTITAPAPAPLAQPPLLLPGTESAPARPAGGPQFTLTDVVIEGSTVFPAAELHREIEPFLGKTATVEQAGDLVEIVLPGDVPLTEALARRYRREGYILARAVIPAGQEIDPAGGIVKVRIYEGYINTVRLDPLEYEVGERGALVRSTLKNIERACYGGDKPQGDQPCALHKDVLERYLLLANDLPGVKATAVIQPAADASGGADLFVTISEKPYSAFAKVDNRGSVYTGPFRADLGGSLNNLTDYYERTTARVIAAKPLDELLLFDVVEELPLNSYGTRGLVNYTQSQSKPGDILRASRLKSKTQAATIAITQPVIRSRSENLFVRGGFDYRNSLTQINTEETTLFDDRTRTLSIGATYDLADRYFGVNLFDIRYSHGLPILNASRKNELAEPAPAPASSNSRAFASGEFAKITAEASRLQRLLPEFNLLTSVAGQYSFSKLLVGEQFGFGGERYGRAYDPSEMLGDHGIAAKLELQYNPAWTAAALDLLDVPLDVLRSFQLYGFYDFGAVWQIHAARQTAAAAGFGIRFGVTDWVTGYFEAAKPLTREVAAERAKGEDGSRMRYFFSLATSF